jgi:hypothetical protein
MNFGFKAGLVQRYGTARNASKATGIAQSCLSHLVQGRREPTWGETRKLLRIFTVRELNQFFPKPKTTKLEGQEASNE